MENGIYSMNCCTDFPSVTYPTHPTILTGTYAGDFRNEPSHGVTGYHWMDRATSPPELRNYGGVGTNEFLQIYKLNSDLGKNCQTWLEMIGEGNRASITQLISRGANYVFPKNKLRLALYYELLTLGFLQKKHIARLMAYVNGIVVQKLVDTFKNPKKYFKTKEAPIGSNVWFMTPDILMHTFGYDSYLYKLNIMLIDRLIGFLIKELDKLGYLDDTVIAITSDHGNYRVQEIGNITPFYISTGLNNYHKRKNPKGMVNITEFASVGHFHLKGSSMQAKNAYWPRPTLKELQNFGPKKKDMIKELFKLKGAELMYYRDDENTHKKGRVYLKRKDSGNHEVITNIIEYKGTGSQYRTKYFSEDGDKDVFGYLNDDMAASLMDGKYHSIDEWLEKTHHLDHAMYPDLIPRHFKNSRSADIIVSTLGKMLYKVSHGKKERGTHYTHDIGLRKSSIVPLIIAGSQEVPKKNIPFCKTTDIVPTLIKMLGKKCHESVVGRSLY